MSLHPYLLFFPLLRVQRSWQVGEWCVGKPPDEVKWKSDEFKALAQKHMDTFSQAGFHSGALVWHREQGFDGTLPSEEVRQALEASVCFAALDTRDLLGGGACHAPTSENARFYVQPINVAEQIVTQVGGGLLRSTMLIGVPIGDPRLNLPDAVVALESAVPLSGNLMRALFDRLIVGDGDKPLEAALRWHRFAMSNPSAITLHERIVAIKTAFEAITGKGKTRECGAELRKLFASTCKDHLDHLPWQGLLWSPKEKQLQREYEQANGRKVPVTPTEFEDWFQGFGETRNSIIHNGRCDRDSYPAPPERPLSRYAGHWLYKSERVLREAIKARLGVELLLQGRIEEVSTRNKIAAELNPIVDAHATAAPAAPVPFYPTATCDRDARDHWPDVQRKPGTTEGNRNLHDLLAQLGATNANHVRIDRLPSSRSSQAWEAYYEGFAMLLTEAEAKTLYDNRAEYVFPQSATTYGDD